MKTDAENFMADVIGQSANTQGYAWIMPGLAGDTKKETFRFPADLFSDIYDELVEFSKTSRVWIGLTPLSEAYDRPKWTRPSAKDAVHFFGFFQDIDVKDEHGVAHAQSELPATYQEAFAFVDGLPMQPTWLIDSGHGLHAYWVVKKSVFASDNDRQSAARELRRLASEFLGEAFTKHGWKFDAVHDLARLSRLPGTWNNKVPTDPKLVTVVRRGGPTYKDLSSIKLGSAASTQSSAAASLPGAPTSTAKYRVATTTDHDSAMRVLRNGADAAWKQAEAKSRADEGPKPAANFAAVAEGCPFTQSALARAEKLPEPEWFKFLGIVGRCHNGDAIAHSISKADQRYVKAETARKLKDAKTYAVTCDGIDAEHPGHCTSCPARGLLRTPLDMGWTPLDIIKLSKSWVYWPAANKFVDIHKTDHELVPRAFDLAHAARQPRAAELLTASPVTRNIEGKDYVPGGQRMVPGTTWPMLNTYRDPGLDETRDPEVEQVFMDHLRYLAGQDEDQFGHILNYLASVVQSPEKIAHALLFISAQGTGKSLLASAMEGALGASNYCSDAFGRVNAKFNEHVHDRQLLVIEELQTDKRGAANDIKTLLSEPRGKAEPKGKQVRLTRHPIGVIILTNEAVPMLIDQSDRRLYVVKAPDIPRPQSAYQEFVRIVLGNPGALRGFLKSVDLKGFDRKARPATTDAKLELLNNSKGRAEQLIEEAIAEGIGPGATLASTLAEWRVYLTDNKKIMTPQQVAVLLRQAGLVDVQARGLGGTNRRIWVKKEIAGDSTAIREAMKSFPQDIGTVNWSQQDPRIAQLRLAKLKAVEP